MMPKNSQLAQTGLTTQKTQMPSKRVYSREFKLETLRLLKSSGKTKAVLERELGLYPGQIHLWERAFNREGGKESWRAYVLVWACAPSKLSYWAVSPRIR